MNPSPKTIQIFLTSGEPRGIRIAEITTRIVQVIEVPRSLLNDFLRMPESLQVGLYFLIGSADDSATAEIYLGQTGDLRARLVKHNKEKDFWERALIWISRTNSLTQTHAVFLEWHALNATRVAGRYSDVNGNSGSKPYTPAPLEADCLEIFETGKVLLSTLGYPVFDPLHRLADSSDAEEIFYCRGSGADGRGTYSAEGFVVLKGSIGRLKNVPSIEGTAAARFRESLLTNGVVRQDGDKIVFDKDHAFGSPSWAAISLMGRTANGWIEWKNDRGVTLDQIKRQVVMNGPLE